MWCGARSRPKVGYMDGVRQLQNRILNSLPPDIFCEIIPSLEPVTLERGQVIVTADQPIDYLYFLCRGIGSVITVSSSGQLAEAGMVGREGFGPTSLAVGAQKSIQIGRAHV